MRVLIDYRPALRERSGVGEYVHQLARALLARSARGTADDVAVTLFSSSWKDRPVRSELAAADWIDRRVPVSVLNFAWHRLGWPTAELIGGASFDLVHSLHPLLMPSHRAAGLVTVHDLNFLAHPERTRAEIRRDYPRLAHVHAHRADRVIVPSRFTAAEVERQLEVPAAMITVCSPGAPDWTARPTAPADGYILFFGTLEPRKNVGTLLDAYERLLQLKGDWPDLVLAGQATPESGPWLERIARSPLAGRVKHIGYVDPSARQGVYAGARLLVQPSFEEGFGITVLEAMTVGVPVVAAHRGALPEVLGETGLLVDAEDPAAMCAAIRQVLTNPSMAASCAASGVERARQFRWSATAETMVGAYRAAVEHRARATRNGR